MMLIDGCQCWLKWTLQFQNQVHFPEWTSAWFPHVGGHCSLIFSCGSSASEETSVMCTVALYSELRDFNTIWQRLHKTSCGLWKIWCFHCLQSTHCATLNSSSKLNRHALYHFWVQMAVGPPHEDIYGHIHYPFHLESPGCDHHGLRVRAGGSRERRAFCESALHTRGMQDSKVVCIHTTAESSK